MFSEGDEEIHLPESYDDEREYEPAAHSVGKEEAKEVSLDDFGLDGYSLFDDKSDDKDTLYSDDEDDMASVLGKLSDMYGSDEDDEDDGDEEEEDTEDLLASLGALNVDDTEDILTKSFDDDEI